MLYLFGVGTNEASAAQQNLPVNFENSQVCSILAAQPRSSDMLVYVKLEAGFNLRSAAVNGSIKVFVPKGNTVVVTQFFDAKYSDGYRWMTVSWNGWTGYMQYDPALMDTYGSASGSALKVKLDTSKARIRKSEVSGAELTIVPIGSTVTVYSISTNKYSDGYKWMYVSWGSYTGYMQYDPYVMHLLN